MCLGCPGWEYEDPPHECPMDNPQLLTLKPVFKGPRPSFMFSYRAGHGDAGHTSALTSDRNSDRYRLQRLGGLCCILNMLLKIQDHLDKLAKLAEETNEIAIKLLLH